MANVTWFMSYLQVTSTGLPYPYPYYYPESVAITKNGVFPEVTEGSDMCVPPPVNIDDIKLLFFDDPPEVCLPTEPQTQLQFQDHLALCGGMLHPVGSYLGFTTNLVGVNLDGSPGPPMYQWTGKLLTTGPSGGSRA
jgi:hypothetical protein